MGCTFRNQKKTILHLLEDKLYINHRKPYFCWIIHRSSKTLLLLDYTKIIENLTSAGLNIDHRKLYFCWILFHFHTPYRLAYSSRSKVLKIALP